MKLQKLLTILHCSIGDHIEEAHMVQINNAIEDILLKLEEEGYVNWICTHGHDRCGEIYSGSDCQYCERRLLFR